MYDRARNTGCANGLFKYLPIDLCKSHVSGCIFVQSTTLYQSFFSGFIAEKACLAGPKHI